MLGSASNFHRTQFAKLHVFPHLSHSSQIRSHDVTDVADYLAAKVEGRGHVLRVVSRVDWVELAKNNGFP